METQRGVGSWRLFYHAGRDQERDLCRNYYFVCCGAVIKEDEEMKKFKDLITKKFKFQNHAKTNIFPGPPPPPPQKKTRGHPQLEPRPANRAAVQPEGTRPIQPRDTATGGANTGVRPGLHLPASAATTGVRPTQTEGHRQREE